MIRVGRGRRRSDTGRVGWAPFPLVAGALVVLVWFGRDMTFYHDEFAFLLLRDLSVDGVFSPHNEHLSATLVVLYRVLLGTVGMASYWPYLAVTFALHVVVASIVYVVVRREAGPDLGARRDGRRPVARRRAATTSCGRSSRARSVPSRRGWPPSCSRHDGRRSRRSC